MIAVRIVALVLAATLLGACSGDSSDAGGDFDCALWRRRADDATAAVERAKEALAFYPNKGLGDSQRLEAVRRIQDQEAAAARMQARAARACTES